MDWNVVFDAIDDSDEDGIIFSCIDGGAGEFPVDGDDGFGWAEAGGVFHHHLETIAILKISL